MNSHSLHSTRRCFVLGALAAMAFAGATPARAGDAEQAGAFIAGLARDTVAVVADAGASDAEREDRLRGLLERGFDTETISRFVLGHYWRNASEAQQRAFVDAFRDYTVASYARRFASYDGHSLQVTGTRDHGGNGDSTRVVVSSTLQRPAGGPVNVDWRVRQTVGGWRIYDVVVEGVSMALTQRSEFAAVIQRDGGIPGLLDQLRDRTAQLVAAAPRRAS